MARKGVKKVKNYELLSIIKPNFDAEEVDKVIAAIQAIDEHAFINVINTEQINGRFYKPPTR